MVGISRRLDEKLGDSRENRDSWLQMLWHQKTGQDWCGKCHFWQRRET